MTFVKAFALCALAVAPGTALNPSDITTSRDL
jgi:hypothetical protein